MAQQRERPFHLGKSEIVFAAEQHREAELGKGSAGFSGARRCEGKAERGEGYAAPCCE